MILGLLQWLQDNGFSIWLRESDSIWALPTVLTLHTAGLAILVGSSWALDLRVLGVGRHIPLAPMRSLFRAMWTGFWVNAVTGAMLFAVDATRKGTSVAFLMKMCFVALGVMTIVLIRRELDERENESEGVSGNLRLLAVVSLVVWAMAITAGRLLAYLIESS